MYRCNDVSIGYKQSKESGETLNTLFSKNYGVIAARAHQMLRGERSDHTLQTNALVHEAYVRMIGMSGTQSQDNVGVLPISVSIMRKVLVDHARKKRSQKRGGDWQQVELCDNVATDQSRHDDTIDILALDDALEKLADCNPLQASIVEQRYFSGMTIEQTATELGLSPATVKRKWTIAQAWLYRELRKK